MVIQCFISTFIIVAANVSRKLGKIAVWMLTYKQFGSELHVLKAAESVGLSTIETLSAHYFGFVFLAAGVFLAAATGFRGAVLFAGCFLGAVGFFEVEVYLSL